MRTECDGAGGRELRRLAALRDKIAALEGAKCRLGHECIDRRPGSLVPLPSALSDHGYARRSICAREVRERRLGCAHTTARLLLADAIAAVDADGGRGDGALARELAALEQWIYALDRERSDAELRHAEIADAQAAAAAGDARAGERELRDLEEQVRSLERAHDACVDRLATLRDEVVQRLSAAIEARR